MARSKRIACHRISTAVPSAAHQQLGRANLSFFSRFGRLEGLGFRVQGLVFEAL